MSSGNAPPVLSDFDHLRVHWYEKWQSYGVKIVQGEYCVSDQEIVITTVLGSCISACIYDPYTGFGGVNHFMLPRFKESLNNDYPMRYGFFSMEELINALLKKGCKKEHLLVKIAGGGKILNNLASVGRLNIEFIEKYLEDESLSIESRDLGGEQARKLVFFPSTGRLLISRIPKLDATGIVETEIASSQYDNETLYQNDVELF